MSDDPRFAATGMPDADWWDALWPDPEDVLRRLDLSAGQSVVDLCCGNGKFLPGLLDVGCGPVYALDCDPVMLEDAKAVVIGHPRAQTVRWVDGDAMALPSLIPDPVDVVFIANTFHGAPDHTGLSRAVRSVLKPEGRFIIIGWYARAREETVVLGQPRGPKTEMRQSPDDLAALVEPAGFVRETVVDLPPYHYGAAFSVTNLK